MKLSDLRPCDFCGQPFIIGSGIWVHTLKVGGLMLGTGAAAIARSAVEWYGGSLRAAEDALPDGAADVVHPVPPEVETTLMVCRSCFAGLPVAQAAVQRIELLSQPAKGLPS